MKLPARFVLVFEGKLSSVRSRALLAPSALPHLLTRLFTGEEMADDALKPFGLKMTVEVDTDGGDEGLDPITDWVPVWEKGQPVKR